MITTSRLRLQPGTVEIFEAELSGDQKRFSVLLGVTDGSEWPPIGGEHDADAVAFFRSQLMAEPANAGWGVYYACLGAALVGSGGYFGPPQDGVVEVGYSVCSNRRGEGIATELVGGLIANAQARAVRRLTAHTKPDNSASVAVLRHNRFEPVASLRADHLRFALDLAFDPALV